MDLLIYMIGWLVAAAVGYMVGVNRPRDTVLPYSATCHVCGDFQVNSDDLETLERTMAHHHESGECDG